MTAGAAAVHPVGTVLLVAGRPLRRILFLRIVPCETTMTARTYTD
jgi:hypothetical protein